MSNARTMARYWLAGVALAGVLAVGYPAAAQTSDQWNSLYDRLIRLEAQVKAGAGGGDSYRVSAIEEQLRQLTGQVQQMGYQMQQMQRQLQELDRLRREGRLGPKPIRPSDNQVANTNLQDGQSSSPQSGYALPPSDQNYDQQTAEPQPQYSVEMQPGSVSEPQYNLDTTATDNGQYQGTAPGPQVLGQIPSSAVNGQQPGAGGPVPLTGAPQPGQGSLVPDQVQTATLDGNQITGTPSGPEQELYQSAYRNLLNRRFGEAEAEFTRFLTNYGKDAQAPAARYFLGEAYFAQGKNKLAAQAFLAGYREYPKSEQAPNSLLKLGMALSALGQKDAACNAFRQVGKEYPQASEARASADAERQRAGCT